MTITLATVFSHLATGELRQTAINTSGTVVVADYPLLINYINLGIQDLYTRFLLMERETIIQMYDSITDYYLNYDFAQTNDESTETYKYIQDSEANPFNAQKAIRILNVYNENGEEWILNPPYVESALEYVEIAYIPDQLHLQIPFPVSTNSIGVTYQAAPNDTATTVTDTTTELTLPVILLPALLLFIAERYFTTMSSSKEEAQVYPSKYEQECAKIEIKNLLHSDNERGTNRFWRNGWV